jgi:transcription elongation GreA/GreB family factor
VKERLATRWLAADSMTDGPCAAIERKEVKRMVSGPSFVQEPGDGDDVQLYSTVRVRDADGEEEYTIVSAADAFVIQGRISMESPVGRALLGRRRGDRIEVRTPGGVRLLTIVGVAGLDHRDTGPSAR